MRALLIFNCALVETDQNIFFSELFPVFWCKIFSDWDVEVVATHRFNTSSCQFRVGNRAGLSTVSISTAAGRLIRDSGHYDIVIGVLPNNVGKIFALLSAVFSVKFFGYVRGDHRRTVVDGYESPLIRIVAFLLATLNEAFIRMVGEMHQLICVGEATRAKYDPAKLRSISIYVSDVVDEGVATKIQFAEGPPSIVYVGRFSREKGVDRIPAFCGAVLSRMRSNALRIHFIGDGDLKRDVLERCSSISGLQVLDHGWLASRQAIADVLLGSQLFISLSRTEGLPKTALEALSCGVPIAVTDVGSVRELFEDGSVGVLLDDDEILGETNIGAVTDILNAGTFDSTAILEVVRKYSFESQKELVRNFIAS